MSLRGLRHFKIGFCFIFSFSVGAFVPAQNNARELGQEYGANEDSIIIRHGPGVSREQLFKDVMVKDFYDRHGPEFKILKKNLPAQTKEVMWTGGYWDTPHSAFTRENEELKKTWRQEYLPPSTEAICSAFVSTVSAIIDQAGGDDNRVTLHRIIKIGNDILLQQSCNYFGSSHVRKFASKRTFSIDQGTIGLCVRTGLICFTPVEESIEEDPYREGLQEDMKLLGLGADALQMARDVSAILAIPFLCENKAIAVLYADSTTRNIFSKKLIGTIIACCNGFSKSLEILEEERVLENIDSKVPILTANQFKVPKKSNLKILRASKAADLDLPEVQVKIHQINFEFSEFKSE